MLWWGGYERRNNYPRKRDGKWESARPNFVLGKEEEEGTIANKKGTLSLICGVGSSNNFLASFLEKELHQAKKNLLGKEVRQGKKLFLNYVEWKTQRKFYWCTPFEKKFFIDALPKISTLVIGKQFPPNNKKNNNTFISMTRRLRRGLKKGELTPTGRGTIAPPPSSSSLQATGERETFASIAAGAKRKREN